MCTASQCKSYSIAKKVTHNHNKQSNKQTNKSNTKIKSTNQQMCTAYQCVTTLAKTLGSQPNNVFSLSPQLSPFIPCLPASPDIPWHKTRIDHNSKCD